MMGADIVVCIPVYNDWDAVSVTIARLNVAMERAGQVLDVLLVDDASDEALMPELPSAPGGLGRVEILRLRRNLGHQRAICIGLAFIQTRRDCQAVVVMDADGEDRPEDVPLLIDRFESGRRRAAVFAQRARRREGVVFRMAYKLYRLVHRVLTGYASEVGNFSILPRTHLDRLVGVSELWNHYAAAVVRARLRRELVSLDRGKRCRQGSRMNFSALAIHGLGAMAVHSDSIGLRMLVAFAGLAVASLGAFGAVIYIRLATDLAIPGWATAAAGLSLVILLLSVLMSVVFILITLQGRQAAVFLPIRDYPFFILTVDTVSRNG